MPDPGIQREKGTGRGGGSDPGAPPPQSDVLAIDFGGEEEEAAEESQGPDSQYGSLPWYQEEFGEDTARGLPWQEYVYGRIFDDVASWAEQIGENPATYVTWLEGQMPHLLYHVDNIISPSNNPELHKAAPGYQGGFLDSPQGLEYIYGLALSWVRSKDARFSGLSAGSGRGSGGGRRGGGGGGGRRGPTAAEIRAQFDLDQLADRVNNIWFQNVLTEANDPRGIAEAYVEAIVRNPEQKLDFDTFVQKRVEGTSRFKTIYRRKPKGMDPATFMQPLFQMAQQAAGPEQAAELSIGAAQFGGDPNAFRERLGRTDVSGNRAPFMQSMERRMNNISSVLKG